MTKKYANRIGWTDVHPCEVLREVSPKTLEIRAMKAERDPTWKPDWIPGGFAGHCTNQNEQRWDITSDPTAAVFRIRLQKTGFWRDANGNRYRLSDKAIKFRDYNF